METKLYDTEASARSSAEMEKLLAVAEDLQSKVDVAYGSILRLRIFLFVFVGALIVAAIYISLVSTEIDPKGLLFAIVAGLLVVPVSEIGYVAPWKKRIRRDQRAMLGIVELLRETEGSVAVKNNWSALERAQFRIRLSRFEIG